MDHCIFQVEKMDIVFNKMFHFWEGNSTCLVLPMAWPSLNMYVSFFFPVKHSLLEKVYNFPFSRDRMSSVHFLLSLKEEVT